MSRTNQIAVLGYVFRTNHITEFGYLAPFYLTRYELKLKTQVDAQLGSVMVTTFF